MERSVHDIFVPYLVRFVWNSGQAKFDWSEKMLKTRLYLLNQFPVMLVNSGVAKFAPTADINLMSKTIGRAVIANVYSSRWTTHHETVKRYGKYVDWVGIYGDYNVDDFDPDNRWDLLRDLYQLALAPDCCKKAYFDSPYQDPYHHLYDEAKGKIKKFPSGHMNPMFQPLGLFIGGFVPCSPTCEHAKAKADQVAEGIKNDNEEVYEVLRMVAEMPLRLDSYRGLSIIETPMFKGLYASDSYKDKYVLDMKTQNPEVFSYKYDWVAQGASFPFKGIFSVD